MLPKLSVKIVSSLEKAFLDEKVADKQEKTSFLMYRNETLSFQLLCENLETEGKSTPFFALDVSGALSPYVAVREVISVPCHFPVFPTAHDEDHLRTAPGLYPDLLRSLHYQGYHGRKDGCFRMPQGQLRALWIDVAIPENAEIPADETELTFTVSCVGGAKEEGVVGSASAKIRVSSVKLPEQKTIHTEWCYTDCIAEAHHVKVFSEKHWQLIEKYMKVAVDNGINMILTPVFTPELDTYIGGERLTTQLVGITVNGDGSYSFDFSLLDRWIDLGERLGVKYYEIPHFFTQWGANHAPKFVAKVKGRTKKIFGWETDSMGAEYKAFLDAFLPALVSHLKERGVDKRCFYHISDEPKLADLERYLACKNLVAPHLEGYHIIDALSDFDFYRKGVLAKPAPAIQHSQPFLDEKILGLWVYYCNEKPVITGRNLSMPLSRTRILGVQLYHHQIEGFLHWGYNFYRNQYSYESVDIFGCTDGEYFQPCGDMCLVYPGTDGEVWESLRLNALREGMDDTRALELCESILGREATEALIHEGLETPLTFFEYPRNNTYLPSLHDRILLAIEQAQK